ALRGIDVFPGLVQRRLRRRQGRVVLQRLLNQGIERRRMKQTPPLARDVQALYETLRGTSRDIGRAGLLRQWLRRIPITVRGRGPLEIRPHRASAKKGGDRGDDDA